MRQAGRQKKRQVGRSRHVKEAKRRGTEKKVEIATTNEATEFERCHGPVLASCFSSSCSL